MSAPDQDQRTVKPSSKRIHEFRKRGEIAISRDLSMVGGMVCATIGLAISAGKMSSSIQELFYRLLGRLDGPVGPALATASATFAGAAAPAAIGALVGWLLSTLQLGWPPVLKTPTFDPTRLFNLGGITQILSPKAALGRVAGSTVKVLVAGGAAALAANGELRDLITSPPMETRVLAARLGSAAIRLGIYAGAAMTLMAVIDFIRTKRKLGKKMMMTPQEAKREHRESDGDPMIKRRRRQKMREMAKRRVAQAVKTADVVIVNPTHYSVAIRYSNSKERAPRVVAKGTDEMAAKIREAARKHGVPIVSRPPLARLLHKVVPEGKEIPVNLYRAVAEILAYVYRLRRRSSESASPSRQTQRQVAP